MTKGQPVYQMFNVSPEKIMNNVGSASCSGLHERMMMTRRYHEQGAAEEWLLEYERVVILMLGEISVGD